MTVLLQTEMEKSEGSATEWARQWIPTWKNPGEFKGKLPKQKQFADLVREEYRN